MSHVRVKFEHVVLILILVTKAFLEPLLCSNCVVCFHLETEGHYFAGEAVPSEERLHGVGQFHLFREHVPQQLVE